MRPLLHWLRSFVLMSALMTMVGMTAWASPHAKQTAEAPALGWACHPSASDTDVVRDTDTAKPNAALPSVSMDDDRAELDVMHELNVPAPRPDTHPPLALALDPADNWPGLPLRPPKH